MPFITTLQRAAYWTIKFRNTLRRNSALHTPASFPGISPSRSSSPSGPACELSGTFELPSDDQTCLTPSMQRNAAPPGTLPAPLRDHVQLLSTLTEDWTKDARPKFSTDRWAGEQTLMYCLVDAVMNVRLHSPGEIQQQRSLGVRCDTVESDTIDAADIFQAIHDRLVTEIPYATFCHELGLVNPQMTSIMHLLGLHRDECRAIFSAYIGFLRRHCMSHALLIGSLPQWLDELHSAATNTRESANDKYLAPAPPLPQIEGNPSRKSSSDSKLSLVPVANTSLDRKARLQRLAFFSMRLEEKKRSGMVVKHDDLDRGPGHSPQFSCKVRAGDVEAEASSDWRLKEAHHLASKKAYLQLHGGESEEMPA